MFDNVLSKFWAIIELSDEVTWQAAALDKCVQKVMFSWLGPFKVHNG